MGGSSSKSASTATNIYDTTVVNNNDLELLNKNINNFISTTVVDQATNCSSSITQLQNVTITDLDASGDIVIDTIDLDQRSAITFDCVQLSAFQNDIANGILSKYMNAIENNYNATSLAQLDTNAKTSSQNQFATTGGSNATANTNSTYKFNNVTNTHQNIQNIVENAITNNLTTNDIQTCMANVASSQSVHIARINAGGNITIQPISLSQSASLLSNCLQERANSNKMTNQIASDLGLTVMTESTTMSKAEMESSSDSQATNTGALQSAGEGVATAAKGVGSALSNILSAFGFGSSTSLYCLIAVIILAIVGACGYYLYQSDGDDFDDQYGGSMNKKNILNIVIFVLLMIIIIKSVN